MYLLAGASLLLLGAPQVSQAQAPAASGPFADVPADHWAYQSVDTLQKAGIVIGYPDGTYGGKRAMTRYEFAVAIARLLPLLNPKVDLTPYATKDELAALRSDLEAKLAANQAALDALTKLVNGFQTELQALGQDVAAIKTRLDALEQRVALVEEEQRRVKFNGDLNLIARADNATDGKPFTDENGVVTGLAGSKRLLQQSDVYHDFLLNIRGKLSDTATANVKVDFGNYLSSLGNTAAIIPGLNGLVPGTLTPAASENTYLYEAYLDAPVGLGPLGGAQIEVGRVPVQFSKYTLEQVDSDIYTNLYQTDSGNVSMDGGKIGLKLGPFKVAAFAGKDDTIPFSQLTGGSAFLGGAVAGSTPFSRPTGEILANHAAAFTQGAGGRATIGSPDAIQISGTFEQFGLTGDVTDPDSGRSYNKLTVYGADANGVLPFGLGGFVKKGGIGVDAAYTYSVQGGANTNTGKGYKFQSQEEQLSAQFGGLALKGGYQYVGPYFSAPGYWGKLGAWTNPTNVRGPIVSGSYAITPKLSLKGDAQFYKAAYGGEVSPLQSDDKVTHYRFGLGYGLSSAYAVDLGYEDVLYDLKDNNGTLPGGAGKPHESYLTFGLGHSFNNNASLKLLYQIVRYDDKGTGFDPTANGGSDNGGVALGQFSLKF